MSKNLQSTPDQSARQENVPLISIIIPCYNQAHFLAEAIISSLHQTYRNCEVIVVDDGSKDNTGEVARQFPVQYVYQQNGGLPAARNTGIAHSTGEYVVFLDSDDRLLPHALEAGYEAFQTCPDASMVVGNHSFISETGRWLRDCLKDTTPQDRYTQLLRSNFIENPACAMYRRALFEQIGGFNPALRASEDYEFYLRIARRFKLFCHDRIVSEYRLHGSSMSRNPELMLSTTLDVFRTEEKFIGGDRERMEAYREGMATWKRKYGRELALQLAKMRMRCDTQTLKRKILTLLREYPTGLVFAVVGCFLPASLLTLPERRRLQSRQTQPLAVGS
jgi:glycosyltransferase involved in cell wall biosynthesis